VLSPGMRLEQRGRPPLRLEAGDVVVFRGGGISESWNGGFRCSEELGGGETLAACFAPHRFAVPDANVGPAVLHLGDKSQGRTATVASLVALIRAEGEKRASSRPLLERLFETLLVAIADGLAPAAVRAVSRREDARIARALSALHARFDEAWTVARMAKCAGLSRAAFARRFVLATRVAPIAYLARVRIDVAKSLLQTTDDPVSKIGIRVGYRSEYAFNRAFKRMVGLPPGVFRRERGAHAAPCLALRAAA
jgi:AraC-like DNA-binding protein